MTFTYLGQEDSHVSTPAGFETTREIFESCCAQVFEHCKHLMKGFLCTFCLPLDIRLAFQKFDRIKSGLLNSKQHLPKYFLELDRYTSMLSLSQQQILLFTKFWIESLM